MGCGTSMSESQIHKQSSSPKKIPVTVLNNPNEN